jgi:hypothetical protein
MPARHGNWPGRDGGVSVAWRISSLRGVTPRDAALPTTGESGVTCYSGRSSESPSRRVEIAEA